MRKILHGLGKALEFTAGISTMAPNPPADPRWRQQTQHSPLFAYTNDQAFAIRESYYCSWLFK